MLERLRQYEQPYALNNYRGAGGGAVFFRQDRGSRLILTAPHAVRIFRDGREKLQDIYTGALTEFAADANGLSVITRRRFTKKENPITDFIIARGLEHHAFLDIHGMNAGREFELAVGTGVLPKEDFAFELELIGSLAEKYRLRWVVNHPDYTGRRGLTGDLGRLFPVPRILQLEWRFDMRDFVHYPTNVTERTLPFLGELTAAPGLFAAVPNKT